MLEPCIGLQYKVGDKTGIITENCTSCKYKMKLEKLDYTHGGCEHTDIEGFACTLFANEGVVNWMIGLNSDTTLCECIKNKDVN